MSLTHDILTHITYSPKYNKVQELVVNGESLVLNKKRDPLDLDKELISYYPIPAGLSSKEEKNYRDKISEIDGVSFIHYKSGRQTFAVVRKNVNKYEVAFFEKESV